MRQIEENLKAERQREKARPCALQIYEDETTQDTYNPETGKSSILIVMGPTRPIDRPITERERPFIIARNSIDCKGDSFPSNAEGVRQGGLHWRVK